MKKLFFMAALLLAMGTIAHARTWSDWWNDTKQHVSKHKGKYIAAALGGTAVYLNRDRLGSYWAGRPTEVQLKKNRPVLENEEYKPTTHKELPDKDYSIEPDKKKLEKQEAIELDKKNDEIQEAIDINRKYGPNRNLSWKDFFKELFYGPTPTMPFDQRKALHEQDNDQAKQAFQKQKEMREQNKKHTYSAKKEEQRKHTEALKGVEKSPSVSYSQRLREATAPYFQRVEQGYNNRMKTQANARRYVTYTIDPLTKSKKKLLAPDGGDLHPVIPEFAKTLLGTSEKVRNELPGNKYAQKDYKESKENYKRVLRYMDKQKNRNDYENNPFAPNQEYDNPYGE